MVVVAQLVRALVCGTRGRRFEPGLPPIKSLPEKEDFFYLKNFVKRSTLVHFLFSTKSLGTIFEYL
jgi:hypothetical protein